MPGTWWSTSIGGHEAVLTEAPGRRSLVDSFQIFGGQKS